MKHGAKRLLSLVLCLCMVLSLVPMTALAAEYPAINLGEDVTVTMNGTDVTDAIFSFTPTETAVYEFYCQRSDYDPCGSILDAEGNVLAENDDYNGTSFFRVGHKMTAGETYLLRACFFTASDAGSMTLRLEKASLATALEISGMTFADRVGAQRAYDCIPVPEGTYEGNLTWTVDDPSVVAFDGTSSLMFLKAGTAHLTVTSDLGISETVEITVVDAADVTLGEPLTADISQYYTASIRFTAPEDGEYVFYSNGSPTQFIGVLYCVDNAGLYTMEYDADYEEYDVYLPYTLKAGETYIFAAQAEEGSEIPFTLGVEKATAATGITLLGAEETVRKGSKLILKAAYEPSYAIREAITWSSSDEGVATVENGTVSFHEKGEVTITATSENGLTASCDFTVEDFPSITCGETVSTYLTQGSFMRYYFTPEQDGVYVFTSLTEHDTYADLYDSTGETLLLSDDDGGGNGQFMLEYEMTAGTTYLYEVRFYYEETEGELTVSLTYQDPCAAGHTMTDGVCIFCGLVLADSIVINMMDSGDNGWSENAIQVYGDGELIATATLSDGAMSTWAVAYDAEKTYEFYWISGNFPEECSFEILIAGTTVLTMEEGSLADCPDGYRLYPVCEHVFGEGVVTPPTCTMEGYTTYSCTLCGYTVQEDVVAALGHSKGEQAGTVVPPTCTMEGYTTYSCTLCGHTLQEDVVAALGHSKGEPEGTVVPPACVEQGYSIYICATCGEHFPSDYVSATGHKPNFEETVVTQATCANKGYTKCPCTVCGTMLPTDFTPALGHVLGEDGNCTVCGELYTIPVWVGGVQITSENMNDVLGDGTVLYDPELNTLELDGFVYDGENAALYSEIPLDIDMYGTNSITSPDYGVYFNVISGDIHVYGEGELYTNTEGRGFAISAFKDVNVTFGEEVYMEINSNDSEGIHTISTTSSASLTLCEDVYVQIGSENEPIGEECIYVSAPTDSSVTITDNAEIYCNTNDEEGIYVGGDQSETLTISGNAEVTVVSDYEGLDANTIVISGGKVNTISSNSEGIYSDDLTISGGVVYAIGQDQGIEADRITITGGTLTVDNGMIASADDTMTPGTITLGEGMHIANPAGATLGECDLTNLDEGLVLAVLNADGTLATDRVVIESGPFTVSVYNIYGTAHAVVLSNPIAVPGQNYVTTVSATVGTDVNISSVYVEALDIWFGNGIYEFDSETNTLTVYGEYVKPGMILEAVPFVNVIGHLNGGSIIDDYWLRIYAPDENGTFSERNACGSEVSIFNPDAFAREGYKLVCYNTKPDGTGTSYAPDAVIDLNEDLELYLIWECQQHSDEDSDGCCDNCSEPLSPASLHGKSLSLNGDIAINFYMALSEEILTDENAYMEFQKEDGTVVQLPVEKAVRRTRNAENYYVFTIPMTSKEMADEVTARFCWSEGVTETYTYSVREYVTGAMATFEDEALQTLLTAMLHYGAAAQLQFNYHTDRLANEGLEAPDYSSVHIEGFAAEKGQATKLLRFHGAALQLNSATAVRFVFRADAALSEFTATCNGETLEWTREGDFISVLVGDIYAKDLDEWITLTVSDGTDSIEVRYSPMSYCEAVQNVNIAAELKTIADALYVYNQAANAYFGNN